MGDSKKKPADSGDTGRYGIPEGGGALELAEPTRDYMCASGGAAEAADDLDNEDDGIDWSGLPDRLTVGSLEELYEKLMEGLDDIEAGRTRPMDDVVNDILRDIENGTI
ncbi:MAG: hypothetical protein FWB85_01805 [Chitinispirillia bacterium]|nr:hypothetical protein [Chitinispirillia bacterium]MCL2241110.1 hypothetical protein [Chitinispirillia bacterium]